MAKPKKDRRAVVDQMRKQQRSSERRRNLMFVGVSVAVGLLIIGAAAYRPVVNWWEAREFEDLELTSIGAPASACGEVTTEPAEGSQQHVPPGTDLSYPHSPPAFGKHWQNWDGMERKFYTIAERPELGMLVHNLEHGYTFLWYDETIAADEQAMENVRAIASKFEGTDNLRMKFKAVPWTSEDGEPFPEGKHVALTHWSAGASNEKGKPVGVWRYCEAPSGEALKTFMSEYPYTDSPEPLGG